MGPIWLLLLLVVNVIYVIVGGVCFSYLEYDQDKRASHATDIIANIRQQLDNDTCLSYERVESVIFSVIPNEGTACRATPNSSTHSYRWDLFNSVMFACTVVTTIGYGHVVPDTPEAQLFFIFYAFLGIPLMMVFLAHVGVHINSTNKKLADSVNCFKNRRLDRFADTVVICFLGVAIFILLPAWVFHHVEGWGYITACYFAVVTLSTIGFGDYIPGAEDDPLYRTLVTVWTLVGLAWFAGVVNNIQSKFQKELDSHKADYEARMGQKITQSKICPIKSAQQSTFGEGATQNNGKTSE